MFIWQLLVVYAFFWGIVKLEVKFEANFSKYKKKFWLKFFFTYLSKKIIFQDFEFFRIVKILRDFEKTACLALNISKSLQIMTK